MKIGKIISIFKGTVRELFKTSAESTVKLKASSTEIAENDRNFARLSASETSEIMQKPKLTETVQTLVMAFM